MKKMASQMKPYVGLEGVVLSTSWHFKVMGSCTSQCKMLLFCAKTAMREAYNFKLAHLKKEEVVN